MTKDEPSATTLCSELTRSNATVRYTRLCQSTVRLLSLATVQLLAACVFVYWRGKQTATTWGVEPWTFGDRGTAGDSR